MVLVILYLNDKVVRVKPSWAFAYLRLVCVPIMVSGLKYAPDTIVTIFVAALQILQIVPIVRAQRLQHGFLSDTQNMGM